MTLLRRHWLLLAIFVLGFLLRIRHLPQGDIMFSYDQARDAYTIRELLHGDLKIQGPPTSTRDFFHGVLYYYVIAPGYWLGQGSPVAAAAWLSFVNSLAIVFAYFVGTRLFASRSMAATTAFLTAVSYEQTQYAVYLANTTLAVLFVPLVYYGLWLWQNHKTSGIILTALGLGLSFQSNFIFIYHSLVILLLIVFRRLFLSPKTVLLLLVTFIISISTMLASEIKFGFPSRNGPANLLFNRSTYSRLSVSSATIISSTLTQFKRLIGLNTFPDHTALAAISFGLCYLGLGFFSRRPNWWTTFSLGLVSFAPPLLLGGISTPYIHAGLGFLVIIFVVYFISRIRPVWLGALPIMVLAYFNLAKIPVFEFAIQKTMTLGYELKVIDYMYAQAGGQPFTFNSITSPLYVNTTWSYLFNWYGHSKYGSLPYWHGENQIGQLGDNLATPPSSIKHVFVVIEPSQGIPTDLIDKTLDKEKYYSTYNHQKQFGEITVQNRTRRS